MKNIKKIFILTTFALICTVLFAGCSDSPYFSATEQRGNNSSLPGSAENFITIKAPEDSADYVYQMYDSDEYYEMSGGGMEFELVFKGLAEPSTLPADRKIIRDANITMEVEDVESSYISILARLTGFGGYESQRNMQSNTHYYSGKRVVQDPVVSATLKIPANNLDAFLAMLGDEGEIIVSNISSADITEQYFDAQIKLTTLEKTLENYYRFLEEARDIDEQLRITRFINDTTREIEQLKGSLRRWDSLVDYSTVYLYLYRPYEAPVPEPEPREINWNSLSLEDMGWFISSGFLSVVNVIFSVLQWVIIVLATASPVLLPIVILILLLIRRRKKYKKKYMQNKNNNITENVPDITDIPKEENK